MDSSRGEGGAPGMGWGGRGPECLSKAVFAIAHIQMLQCGDLREERCNLACRAGDSHVMQQC